MDGRNDLIRLKKEADISKIVEYCGLRKGRRMGNAQFVECPHPQHNDSHWTNAYYRDGWNTVYCTTCGKNMGAIDVLMWCQGLSFQDAADTLWELEGEPDWYYARRDASKPQRTRKLTVAPSELSLLGIDFSSRITIPVCESKFRNTDIVEECARDPIRNEYRGTRTVSVDWNDFISQTVCRQIIKKKCRKQEKRMAEIERRLKTTNLFAEEREKLQKLRTKAKEAM